MPIRYIRKADPDDPIILVADKMAPKLRQAFLDAVSVASSSVSLKEIAAAIEHADIDRVITLLDGNFRAALEGKGLQSGITSLRDVIQSTFGGAAKAAGNMLPARVSTQLSFNLFNPNSVSAIERYTFDLIREVTADTRQVVRQVLTRAFTEGGHPYEQARQIRGSLGLTAAQEKAVDNYRRALESGDRSALERALRDKRSDRAILRAIEEERTMSNARIDALVERYRDRYVKYRAETISRTESIRAASAGRRESWRQAKEQGLLDGAMREWSTSSDDRVCALCDGLDGETAGLDEEFEGGVMDPPAHVDCRCSVVLIWEKGSKAA